MIRARRVHRAVAFAATLALACATGPAARSPEAEAGVTAPADGRPPMRRLEGDLAEVATEMSGAAQSVRGLLFKRPVKMIEGTPEVVDWLLRRELDALASTGELMADQLTLEAFGFLPHEGDYEALLLDLYQEQVRGLYDHREQLLLVVPLTVETGDEAAAAQAKAEAGLFLLHELVHALQDQHFDLGRFLDETHTVDEAQAARGLVEGDATFAMYEHFVTQLTGRSLAEEESLEHIRMGFRMAMDGPDHAQLREAPLYLRETMMFAYLEGLLFVHALHGEGGWAAVNQAFETPPTTTQQILHPERFFAGEAGDAVVLPPMASLEAAGYESVAGGRLGELGVRLFLAERSDEAPGPGVACGWAGDAYVVHRRDGAPPVAVWAVAFGDAAQAGAFLAAVEAAGGRPGAPTLHARALGESMVGLVTWLPDALAAEVLADLESTERSASPSRPFTVPPGAAEIAAP
jgi:hypothetical protein